MHICGPSVMETSGEKIKCSCFHLPKILRRLGKGEEVQSHWLAGCRQRVEEAERGRHRFWICFFESTKQVLHTQSPPLGAALDLNVLRILELILITEAEIWWLKPTIHAMMSFQKERQTRDQLVA